MRVVWAVLAACALGCGTGEDRSDPADEAEDWALLVELDDTIAAGDDAYTCVLRTLSEDLSITALHAVEPGGVHHATLQWGPPSQTDGVYDCTGEAVLGKGAFGYTAAGGELVLPEGVSMQLPAGTQVTFSVHVVNPSRAPRSVRTGVQVRAAPPSATHDSAEMVLAGTAAISIDPHEQGTAVGHCVFEEDATVIAVWPHMHAFGRHLTVTHVGDGERVLHDGPYSFEQQTVAPIEPATVHAGERLRVECAYENTSQQTVTFGPGARDEMCFAGLFRYPAAGGEVCSLTF